MTVMEDIDKLQKHPDWTTYYYEIRDAGENYALKASGYIGGLNPEQAKNRLIFWARDKRLSKFGGVPQPIDATNIRIMVHPDPDRVIYGDGA